MAERMTGLSIETLFDGNHDHPGIPRFIAEFSQALYSGDGKKPAALVTLGIDADFPVRVLLGVPKKDQTREQRLLAEAFCSVFFGRPLGDVAGLWTSRPGWRPTNPGRRAAPLGDSRLDTEWMLSLGIGKSIWEQTILRADAAFGTHAHMKPTTAMRHLLMLSIFGFSAPYQFFTAKTAPDDAKRNPE